MSPDVIVAGLGTMGGAAAWQCAERGLKVLGFDRFHPPHERGSHHGDSRIIRETAFEHPRYVPLVRRSFALWDELARRAGRELSIPSGVLYAGVPSASVVTGSRQSAALHAVACEELSADAIRRRWPGFAPSDGMVGLFEPRGLVLRPERCISAMLEAAGAAGAELCYDEPVDAWGAADGGVWVETPRGRHTARRLILATGAWMPDVLGPLGVDAWVERVVQHWFRPGAGAPPLDAAHLPVYLWEDADGIIFYGFPAIDGALKCAVHHRGERTTADLVRREVGGHEVDQARALLARYIPFGAGAHERSAVCVYTNSPDGDFIVDRHPQHPLVLLASPCGGIGFKFGPVIGEILADLATGRPPAFDLEPFGLARFSH